MTDAPEVPAPEAPAKKGPGRGNTKGSKRGPYRSRTKLPPVEVTAEEAFETFNARKYLMELGHSMTADMARGLLGAAIQHVFVKLPGIQITTPFDLTLMLQFFEGLTRVVHEIRGEMIKDRATGGDGNVVQLGIGKFSAKQYQATGTTGAPEPEPKPNGNGHSNGGNGGPQPGWS